MTNLILNESCKGEAKKTLPHNAISIRVPNILPPLEKQA